MKDDSTQTLTESSPQLLIMSNWPARSRGFNRNTQLKHHTACTGLKLADAPFKEGKFKVLCNISTWFVCLIVPAKWTKVVFDAMHGQAHTQGPGGGCLCQKTWCLCYQALSDAEVCCQRSWGVAGKTQLSAEEMLGKRNCQHQSWRDFVSDRYHFSIVFLKGANWCS